MCLGTASVSSRLLKWKENTTGDLAGNIMAFLQFIPTIAKKSRSAKTQLWKLSKQSRTQLWIPLEAESRKFQNKQLRKFKFAKYVLTEKQDNVPCASVWWLNSIALKCYWHSFWFAGCASFFPNHTQTHKHCSWHRIIKVNQIFRYCMCCHVKIGGKWKSPYVINSLHSYFPSSPSVTEVFRFYFLAILGRFEQSI